MLIQVSLQLAHPVSGLLNITIKDELSTEYFNSLMTIVLHVDILTLFPTQVALVAGLASGGPTSALPPPIITSERLSSGATVRGWLGSDFLADLLLDGLVMMDYGLKLF